HPLQMAWSCWLGVRPLLLSTWCSLDRAMSEMEPTRIMKNSSRLLVKMAANFSRSNRGTVSSLASASTRSSNRSQDNSRSWVYRVSTSFVMIFHSHHTLEQVALPHAAGADRDGLHPIALHHRIEDHQAGQDGVHPVGGGAENLPQGALIPLFQLLVEATQLLRRNHPVGRIRAGAGIIQLGRRPAGAAHARQLGAVHPGGPGP